MATLAEQLEANTVARRQALAVADWQTIDGSIQALKATGIQSRVLKPGDRAPDFNLPDANGDTVTSADLRARGPLVVKFYRGAWCSYCNVEVRALMGVLD